MYKYNADVFNQHIGIIILAGDDWFYEMVGTAALLYFLNNKELYGGGVFISFGSPSFRFCEAEEESPLQYPLPFLAKMTARLLITALS